LLHEGVHALYQRDNHETVNTNVHAQTNGKWSGEDLSNYPMIPVMGNSSYIRFVGGSMPILRIPTPLRSYTGNQAEVLVDGTTVAQAMESLMEIHPALRPHLFNTEGQIRPFVNLFVSQENIKNLQNLDTPLHEGDKLMIFPSIAGG
jgi:molybdopterin synthase sulfur carrier subunit